MMMVYDGDGGDDGDDEDDIMMMAYGYDGDGGDDGYDGDDGDNGVLKLWSHHTMRCLLP
jgi:hypothetical protein